MQVFILSLGTRGDVELFVTLGRELARRGHGVRFASAALYEGRVREAGLLPVPLGRGSLEQLQAVLSSLATVVPGERPQRFYERWVEPLLPLAVGQIKSLANEIDFFICNMKLGLRRAGRVIPGAAVTYDPPASLETLRQDRVAEHRGRLVEIVALNKALIDPGGLWDADYHFTGFWDEPSETTWAPPKDLLQFLETGPPPAVLAMGSMVTFDPRRLAGVLDDALAQFGQRAIVVEGWSKFPRTEASSKRLFVVAEAPYDWLFDKASCVIHHGGCGTLAAVLRAGAPSILLPQLVCQKTFGQMLLREKLAADVVNIETLSSARLADALAKAVNDEQIQRSARRWQEIRAKEHGVVAAADLIERHWQELQ